jgi:hypothetical protein
MVFAAMKNYAVEHVADCPGEEKLSISAHFNTNNTANIPNKIFFSGYLEAFEKVPAPLDFAFEINRCDLKGEKCEKYAVMKVSDKYFHLIISIINSN